MKKIVKAGLIAIFILFLLFIFSIFIMMNDVRKKTLDLKIENIDFKTIIDGEYVGTYSLGAVKVKTKSSIKDGKIVRVEYLESEHETGKKAEIISDEVIKKQSLEVDAVSGATTSSKVILKSIEKGIRENEL